ncbi:MAG TPA: M24 family metallopeptidase, partial [bacterium]|nr:M24 family metallopeptidase [bacterium]
NEEACFALQYGHGVGLAIWEKPVISRLVSLDHPHEIKPGMVFALETYWPSTDGWSAARIEEEVVVTETGHEVITRFPADQLLVAGAHYFTANGPLPSIRENEPGLSDTVAKMVKAVTQGARAEGSRVESLKS